VFLQPNEWNINANTMVGFTKNVIYTAISTANILKNIVVKGIRLARKKASIVRRGKNLSR